MDMDYTPIKQPDWLFAIGTIEGSEQREFPLGSGFAVNPLCIVTCKHVVVNINSKEPHRTSRLFVKSRHSRRSVKKVYCHPLLDLAIIELREPVNNVAPVISNRKASNISDNPRPNVSIGFPAKDGGWTMKIYHQPDEDFLANFESDINGDISFIKAGKGASEGFSGGALCSEHKGTVAVFGINTLGGLEFGVGGFITSHEILKFLDAQSAQSQLNFAPSNLIDWQQWLELDTAQSNVEMSLTQRQLACCQASGLEKTSITKALKFNGQTYQETFIFVPPSQANEQLSVEGGYWIQQSVMPAVNLQKHTIPLSGANFLQVTAIINQLQQENDLDIRLPTYQQWLNALTAEETYSLPKKARYPVAQVTSQNRQSHTDNHPLNLHLTPRGMYEYCAAEALHRISAYAPTFMHNGKLYQLSMPYRHNHHQVTFRLVLSELPNI
ncbi:MULTISPECIES: S1 family peptidase [Pseudoalteromonas]|uniref:Serine protease n=1 Tax=Pseudoalteromonas maricaloris TaxID=184924 RepID=A0A8I2KMC2_9GAMM|nr:MULTISPECIES: serine protease [Pseudoalteromonas]KID38528.1 hypothetical protein QT15_03395 [Pseudoalteromonas flavipulchra NCIMB 2033 = ATCC BAA-314]MBD0783225.1 trypsin-like peptidase domain-containing protein [Pseudoalteromonas flavipulchra]MBE0371881.1 hypothetical protein [Pseudoalteromonas flavipulchra NCIMB 2033 = ATCC BAA-314]NLR22564.1 trypsin-like peptidase domain-containing protein [Pseudoalteromonas maricaloris]RZG14789.1 serine protease [Pseudoalteromonas sp. CO342X]